MARATFAAALLLLAPLARAQPLAPAGSTPAAQVLSAPAVAAPDGGDEVSTGGLLFKTLAVLVVVVAVIYLTLNVGARKLLKLSPQAGALVKVVDRVALEPKKCLYVLQIGGEYLLVGSSEGTLVHLAKLEPEAVQHALAERLQINSPASFLERLMASRAGTDAKPGSKGPS